MGASARKKQAREELRVGKKKVVPSQEREKKNAQRERRERERVISGSRGPPKAVASAVVLGMSATPISSSPSRVSFLSTSAPIYPRHVELTAAEIAAKERRESSGILTPIRPPSLATDIAPKQMIANLESSYLWYALQFTQFSAEACS